MPGGVHKHRSHPVLSQLLQVDVHQVRAQHNQSDMLLLARRPNDMSGRCLRERTCSLISNGNGRPFGQGKVQSEEDPLDKRVPFFS